MMNTGEKDNYTSTQIGRK